MIPFFLRHYEPLVDRMIVYDDRSTDRSVELLKSNRKVDLRHVLDDKLSYLRRQYTDFEHVWHESRGKADWIITCDIDEHLYHSDFRKFLNRCRGEGVTAIQAQGFDMVAGHFPPPMAHLATTISKGLRNFHLDKTAIFDPNSIQKMNYTPGRHLAHPVGRVLYERKRAIKLLHYKNLGADYLVQRIQELAGRATADDVASGWNLHNVRSATEIRLDFEKRRTMATEVLAEK